MQELATEAKQDDGAVPAGALRAGTSVYVPDAASNVRALVVADARADRRSSQVARGRLTTVFVVEVTHSRALDNERMQEQIAQRVFNKLAERGDQPDVVVRNACSYPKCECPIDGGVSQVGWCARGLPHVV